MINKWILYVSDAAVCILTFTYYRLEKDAPFPLIALMLTLRRDRSLTCPVSPHCTAACPLLCSGNGQYSRGRCQCYSGWKGTECDVPSNQCIDIHCGGHGICIIGACICNTGYKGDNCEEGIMLLLLLLLLEHEYVDIRVPYKSMYCPVTLATLDQHLKHWSVLDVHSLHTLWPLGSAITLNAPHWRLLLTPVTK